MKKLLLLSTAVLSTFIASNVDAAEIKGQVRSYPNEVARDFVSRPNGTGNATTINWWQMGFYNDLKVVITDANNQVVFDGTTGTTNQGGGDFSKADLPVGTYTVEIKADLLTPIPHVQNNNAIELQKSLKVQVEVTDVNQVIDLKWLLASQSKQVLSYSLRGSLPNGQTGQDQNGKPISYRIWYQGGNVATPHISNGVNYVFFRGALANDTLGMYSDVLTRPTLSADEVAYGWTFQGWRINGSDKIYSEEEVRSQLITRDMQLEAAWTAPRYTVTFATDTDKGLLDGKDKLQAQIEGNSSVIGSVTQNQLPVPAAKAGYEFIGWFKDQTTNVIDPAELVATPVKSDVTYYAKYRKTDVDIKIGDNGNWFIDGHDTGKSSVGQTGATGKNLTVEKTTTDADGNTVLHFSDGTQATVLKGKDGIDGKDGKDGQSITILKTETTADGSIILTFSDNTSVEIFNGKDGKDGQSITVTNSEFDKDGNTVITFSDKSQVVVKKGKDGETPVVTHKLSPNASKGEGKLNESEKDNQNTSKEGDSKTTQVDGKETPQKAQVKEETQPSSTKVESTTSVIDNKSTQQSSNATRTEAKVLPKTGDASSVLTVVGLVMSSGLVALKRKK